MPEKKLYTVHVAETCRLWGHVTVMAENQDEAEQLAGEDFVPDWSDSVIEERTTTILTENGVAVEWSEEAHKRDCLNPYRPKDGPEQVSSSTEQEEQRPEAAQAQIPTPQVTSKKTFTVEFFETQRLSARVQVEAEDPEEAELLAEENYDPDWQHTTVEERGLKVLNEQGESCGPIRAGHDDQSQVCEEHDNEHEISR